MQPLEEDIDGIPFDEEHFPDANFRAYLAETFPAETADKFWTYAELDSVNSIECPARDIADMTGIEYFRKMQFLSCSDNPLTSLDVSHNPLWSLTVNNANLTDIDLTRNDLHTLEMRNNQLAELDLTQCPNLYFVWCDNNNLTEIDVSPLTKMRILSVSGNPISSLDLTNQSDSLRQLQANDCLLTEIDVTNLKILEILHLNRNSISSIDLSQNPELVSLWVAQNQLPSLDVTHNKKLVSINCYNNAISGEFDITKCTKLEYLECQNNLITKLDVTQCPEIYYFNFGNNQVESIDVTNCPKLKVISAYQNPIGPIDLSNCPLLERLYSYNTQLTSLDISNKPNLNRVWTWNAKLTYLNVSNNPSLKDLGCGNNKLTYLDLTSCLNITALSCNNNNLTSLDLSHLNLESCDVHGQTTTFERVSKFVSRYLTSGRPVYVYFIWLDDQYKADDYSFDDLVHIAEGETPESFVPFSLDRVVEWGSYCELFHGTRQDINNSKLMALSDGIDPAKITGDILLVQSGRPFTYYYDTYNSGAQPMDVTVSWTASAITTGIDELETTDMPVTTRYFNAAGQASESPWQGVNIIDKVYNDGHHEITKEIFK